MRLYSVGRSPFAARVRGVIYFKGAPVAIVPPPEGGIKGPDYLAINPLGRLPALVLDDGSTLPESEVIVEYLEDAFPEPALRPTDLAERARSRLVARIAELYIMAPLFGLFLHLSPMGRDHERVEQLFSQIKDGLGYLDVYLGPGPYAIGATPTLADTALVPFLCWVEEVARMFSKGDPLDTVPKLRRYQEQMVNRPVFGKISKEIFDDLAALRAR
jgi:glutathione S-transferase